MRVKKVDLSKVRKIFVYSKKHPNYGVEFNKVIGFDDVFLLVHTSKENEICSACGEHITSNEDRAKHNECEYTQTIGEKMLDIFNKELKEDNDSDESDIVLEFYGYDETKDTADFIVVSKA